MEIGPGLSATAREISSTVCGVATFRMLTGYSAVTSVTATVESVRVGSRTSGASYKPIRLTPAENIRSTVTTMPATRSTRRMRDRRTGSSRGPLRSETCFFFSILLERNHDIRQDLALECLRVCRLLRARGGARIHPTIQWRDVARRNEPG